MNARREFLGVLKPLLPSTWVALPYTPTPGTIGRASLYIAQTRVARNEVAPRMQDDTTLTLTLVEPTISPGDSDDRLDAALDQLLDALDRLDGVTWEAADRSTLDGTYPCYSIPVTFLTSRKD